MPIGSVVRMVTYCTVPGQVSTCTRQFQLFELSGATQFLSTDFLIPYDTAMVDLMVGLLANSAGYYGTQMYLDNPQAAPPRPDSTSAFQMPGTGGVGLAPTQTSGLISFYTNVLGKMGQGRMYVPFPSAEHISVDGTPTVGYQDSLDDLGTYLSSDKVIVNAGVTARFAPVMYSGGIATAMLITGHKSHNAWATQRKRGSFGRTNSTPF